MTQAILRLTENTAAVSDAAILRATGISKAFGATQALDLVDFSLQRGSIHALLGGNGAGKSTLIKVFAGVQHADSGQLDLAGRTLDARLVRPANVHQLGMRFVHQQNATFPSLSIIENMALGSGFITGRTGQIDWKRQRARTVSLLEHYGIAANPDDRISDISPAKKKMVEIARALQDIDGAGDAVLVLDEPTASLPTTEVDLLLDALRSYAAAGQAIIYVTHRLEEVFAIADAATVLRNGRHVATLDPRRITPDHLIEHMMGKAVSLARKPEPRPTGQTLLALDRYQVKNLQPVSLHVMEGEVVGIAGLIGSGRTRFLKGLFGGFSAVSGTMHIRGQSITLNGISDAVRAGIAYVPEDRVADALFGKLSIADNSAISGFGRFWNGWRLRKFAELAEMSRLIDEFLIKAAGPDAAITSLSGGNQQKVVLARWMRLKPSLLLLDEPTQGVDVGARAEIYHLIDRAVAAGSAAIVVSSDFEELVSHCDRVVIMRNGALIGEVIGDQVTVENLNMMANA